jgi:hypothetical protein
MQRESLKSHNTTIRCSHGEIVIKKIYLLVLVLGVIIFLVGIVHSIYIEKFGFMFFCFAWFIIFLDGLMCTIDWYLKTKKYKIACECLDIIQEILDKKEYICNQWKFFTVHNALYSKNSEYQGDYLNEKRRYECEKSHRKT